MISRKTLLDSWLYIGMLLFLAGFFLAPDNGVHKDIYYSLIVLPFMIACLCYRDLFRSLSRAHYVTLALLACLALPLLWSDDLGSTGLIRIVRNLTYLSALLITINYLMEQHPTFLERAVWVLLLSALVVGLYLLVALFLSVTQINNVTLISDWRFNTQNRMAKAYGVIAILCLPQLPIRRHWWCSALAAVVLTVSIAVILLSRSKGATYALLLTLPTILILQRQSALAFLRHWHWALPFVLVSCAIAAEIGVVNDFLGDGWSKRDYIWRSVLETVRTSPLFGIGYLLDPHIVGSDGETYTHEHNLFMALLRQSGLVGITVFVAWLGFLMSSALRARDNRTLLWLTVLIYGCFASLSGDKYPLQAPVEMWLWFWIPVAVLLALISIPQHRSTIVVAKD